MRSIRGPFIKLVKSAEEYSDTHARMPQDKLRPAASLIDKDAAAPKWEDMVAKLTLCEAFMCEVSEHIIGAMHGVCTEIVSMLSQCFKFAREDGQWKEVLLKKLVGCTLVEGSRE